ncbi:MacB-like core domain-containing protein [Chitinophaga terrae (ex Kim and Jung 2007)]|uniref:MacB-like core domain-containing protein n=1 Tax=Chitinophaga terrae (ex Kim and Jung 2007) TaxID=408074 RepID=A0A1H4GA81_9BACT|nr:ABC transporter permease [Chitinophaga terrae (ex Kim and Jung 2007)]GEP93259.1 hypothetical protein CTE07_49040 [Chitinophaga terrae (ex Kim and Jung 2007)]SEB06337.1 MacB-like core domain-containing protein [Chitinophaga terrae (ex Kim and Jung 2007)]
MIRNYIKMALRNLMRNRRSFFVNMIGLVVGFSACLGILLVLSYEQSYDNFHAGKDRIYRLVREDKKVEAKGYGAGIPFPMASAIAAEYPQVEATAQMYGERDVQVIVPSGPDGANRKFLEAKGVFFTTPQFFKIFNFRMKSGTTDAIREPGTALLTEDYASQF